MKKRRVDRVADRYDQPQYRERKKPTEDEPEFRRGEPRNVQKRKYVEKIRERSPSQQRISDRKQRRYEKRDRRYTNEVQEGFSQKGKFEGQARQHRDHRNFRQKNYDQKYYREQRGGQKEKMKKIRAEEERGFKQYQAEVQTVSLPKESTYLNDWLKEGFRKGNIECLICFEAVSVHNKIWSCEQCYQPFHLACLNRWAKVGSERQIVFRCPKCVKEYSMPQIPVYLCFCKKYRDPEYHKMLLPHSCGEICGKLRGLNCTHPCSENCHPGFCPPCQALSKPIQCFCGKRQKILPCSQSQEKFTCGTPCQKPLGCGRHVCQQLCHEGPCHPCEQTVQRICFCEKKKESLKCGEEEFSCGEKCGRLLKCKEHACNRACHKGDCGGCSREPALVKTCPCGRYLLDVLLTRPRKSCADQIPLCGMPCRKRMVCGHLCTKMCHEDQCGDCKEAVEENCRCGANTRKHPCSEVRRQNFFICGEICRKKKDCKRHACGDQCCVGLNHRCDKICKKLLPCKIHQCQLRCHAQPCGHCPNIGINPLPCHCGKTFQKPPIFCGTLPEDCGRLCQKLMACGHKCCRFCHAGPCKCNEPAKVFCDCGKAQIQSVCGMDALCFSYCDKLMPCGHSCGKQCHKPGDCQTICTRKCGKQRSDCQHTCLKPCHEGECPAVCEQTVQLKCQCGNLQVNQRCGSLPPPCNQGCGNLKRFRAFYQKKAIYYPASLLRFARNNQHYLCRLQKELKAFIGSGDRSYTSAFKGQNKNVLLTLLSKHYFLKVSFTTGFKFSITVETTPESMVPNPTLSEVASRLLFDDVRMQQWGKEPPLPFEMSLRFIKLSHNEAEVLLKKYTSDFYLEYQKGSWYAHFWDYRLAMDVRAKILPFAQTSVLYTSAVGQKLIQGELKALRQSSASSQQKEITFELYKSQPKEGKCKELCCPAQAQRQPDESEAICGQKVTKFIYEEQDQLRDLDTLRRTHEFLIDQLDAKYLKVNQKRQLPNAFPFAISRWEVVVHQFNTQGLINQESLQSLIRAEILAFLQGVNSLQNVPKQVELLRTWYRKTRQRTRKALRVRSIANVATTLQILGQVGIVLSAAEPFFEALAMALDLEASPYPQLATQIAVETVVQAKALLSKKKFKQYIKMVDSADFMLGCVLFLLKDQLPQTDMPEDWRVRAGEDLAPVLAEKRSLKHVMEELDTEGYSAGGQAPFGYHVGGEYLQQSASQRYLSKVLRALKDS